MVGAGDQLAALGRRFKTAGNGAALRHNLIRECREVGAQALPKVRSAAESQLPGRGGLADLAAGASYTVRTRLTGADAGVRVVAQSGPGIYDVPGLDAGRVRHPTFGHSPSVAQSVPPGYFTRTVQQQAGPLRVQIEQAMERVARQIES